MPYKRPTEKSLKNLDVIRTSEQAKAKGRAGGIKSGIVKREKKLLSHLYAEYLFSKHKLIDKDGNAVEMTGEQLVEKVVSKVLFRGDSSSVSMIKEMREGTEGNKVALTGANNEELLKGVKIVFEEPADK